MHITRFHGRLAVGMLAALAGSASVSAQAFTKADSGWVKIFNGTDFTGLYSRNYGATVQPVRPVANPYIIQFAGTDTATIRVNATSPQGNFGTDDTTFSHYRLRWESKYDAVNANSNSGMTYHMDESAARMQNNWPRSIEFQGKQSEIGSAFSIQQVAFNTTTTGAGAGSNYSPTGTVRLACEYGCNGRWYKGNPLITPFASGTPNVTRWLRFHLIARGADSAIHIVNDTTVMRLWNIRIFNDSTQTSSNRTPNRPWGSGGLGWQAEGAIVNYRRLEVMKMPASTPMNEHFLHRLFLDAPARTFKPAANAVVNLGWRSIGTIPKVKIEYRVGAGAWQVARDSVPNTGAFAWTAPASVPDSVNVRISSLDYVWGDSTSNPNTVSLYARAAGSKGPLFTVKDGALVIPEAAAFSRIEIRDASGRMLRALPGGRAEVRWDLADAQGSKVGPGLYFLRLSGAGEARSARVLVD